MAQIILLNKPFNVLCQFSDNEERSTLATVIDSPAYKDFYPAGRLDYDSEGLVILTNNGQLQHRITDPNQKMEKTYWVQVEGNITQGAINKLQTGVDLKDGRTLPAHATCITAPQIWLRHPPIRSRQNIDTQWLELRITEGKNRQVRRMTAAVGNPTLRLIRVAIGPWQLDELAPGEFKALTINLPRNNIRRRNNIRGDNKFKKPK